MKQVSIQDFKQHLSQWISEAAGGEEVVITRHNRPIAALSAYDLAHLHLGPRFGRAALEPLLHRGSQGVYLEVLAEDRREDR